MTSRTEKIRQRAVALGLIQDDGPVTAEAWALEQERNLALGITEDDLCDQMDELLNDHEDRGVRITWEKR